MIDMQYTIYILCALYSVHQDKKDKMSDVITANF